MQDGVPLKPVHGTVPEMYCNNKIVALIFPHKIIVGVKKLL